MYSCLHCGTPVPSNAAAPQFCCPGCSYVHELLHSQGMDRFYDLRGINPLPPVPPQAMRERDYGWLLEMAANEEARGGDEGRSAFLTLSVQGLSCVACVWLMEKIFQSMAGARRLQVHAARGELHLEWEPHGFDVVSFARQLQRFGYLVGPSEAGEAGTTQASSFNLRVGMCGAFAMNAMAFTLPAYLGMGTDFMFASWFDIIAACTATLSLLVGGSYFAERSFFALRHGLLHIDTPITLGILAAWCGSMGGWLAGIPSLKYFDFVAIFIFLMLGGRWLQTAAVERNRRRLLKSTAVPEHALREGDNDEIVRIKLVEIATGDVLCVKAGEVFPVSCDLTSDEASLSLEWINGESDATCRTRGQRIPSGAMNIGTRQLHGVARETWGESLLHKLAHSRASGEGTSLYFAGLLRSYLTVVVCVGLAGALWWWLTGQGAAMALQVMISVFVVSCPCALGVSAPFADDFAATWMERLGVFVRTPHLWPRLARVRHVVFDKTGTLTLENPVLKNPETLAKLPPEARQALHHLADSNLHPVSRSLSDALGMGADARAAGLTATHEVIGQGLTCKDSQGRTWALGRPNWRGGFVVEPNADAGMDVELSLDGRVLASFAFKDELRPETVRACAELSRKGCRLYLFSGDRHDKVAGIARRLGIPPANWQSRMTPQEKAARVRAINHDDTLFIGDGANDSLALEAALCGGSPVTSRNFLEHKADFFFLGNSLRFVATLLDVAQRRQRAVRRVFAFALAYNLGAIMLSLGGWMSPLLAAILMPASSVISLALARASFSGLSVPEPLAEALSAGKPDGTLVPSVP